MRVIIVGDTGVKDAVIAAPFTDDETPILYVKKDSIPVAVDAELLRLSPDEILVFGGTARVSDAVVSMLVAIAPTTRIAGPSVFGTAIEASKRLNPVIVDPPVEPPVDPPVDPPTDMFIPKLQGPVLMHDGNPDVISGFIHNTSLTRIVTNTKILGPVRITNGLVIFRDCEFDGQQGDYCVAGWGGRGLVERSWVHNAQDGFKDNIDSVQVTITDLYLPSGVHGDCVQLQNSGSKATHKWGYFDCGVGRGNAAFIIKNDLGNGALQEITVEDSFVGGGNYTVYLRVGGAGGAPAVSDFRRILYRKDNWKWGLVSYNPPAPSTWDVSSV